MENLKFIKSVEILRRVVHPSMGGAGGKVVVVARRRVREVIALVL